MSSPSFDLDSSLSHAMGNMMNEIIFGRSYHREDEMWVKLQRLRAEGQCIIFDSLAFLFVQ